MISGYNRKWENLVPISWMLIGKMHLERSI